MRSPIIRVHETIIKPGRKGNCVTQFEMILLPKP